ncbi:MULTISPECIES: hypothetical protein [unclassified Nodosilinea]|jgi:hypothetical protein|uniref:Uncharacterized protein n=1 Tax=Leptolyngbya subtilissima DQ-A4 TaxID=2933933 RepID=A0ABV0K3M8_9CYAN|nr:MULTISPECIES: hypothetical protein [unclassified Nodosilinea]
MARYTNTLPISATTARLRDAIVSSLQAFGLNMVYETSDYLMAKEQPGQVSLAQLTTIEVLISPPTVAADAASVNLVVSNQELPLRHNNHCEQVFSAVNQAIVALV